MAKRQSNTRGVSCWVRRADLRRSKCPTQTHVIASLPMRLSGTSWSRYVDLTFDPKGQPGFRGLGSYRDGAHNCNVVVIENYPFDVSHEKLSVCVEIGTCLQAGLGRCTELPDARVHKVLVVSWSCRRSKFSFRPLQSSQLFVESAVCRYVLVICHLIHSIPVYQLPPVVAEGADLLGDPCELDASPASSRLLATASCLSRHLRMKALRCFSISSGVFA
jgi:hypothetical protein